MLLVLLQRDHLYLAQVDVKHVGVRERVHLALDNLQVVTRQLRRALATRRVAPRRVNRPLLAVADTTERHRSVNEGVSIMTVGV